MALFDVFKKEDNNGLITDFSKLKTELEGLISKGFFTAYRKNFIAISRLIEGAGLKNKISQGAERINDILTDFYTLEYGNFKIKFCASNPDMITFQGNIKQKDYDIILNSILVFGELTWKIISKEIIESDSKNAAVLNEKTLSPCLIEALGLHKIKPEYIKKLLEEENKVTLTKEKLKISDSKNSVEITLPKEADVNKAWIKMAEHIRQESFMKDILAYKLSYGQNYSLGLPFIFEKSIVKFTGKTEKIIENLFYALSYLYANYSLFGSKMRKFNLSQKDAGALRLIVAKYISETKDKALLPFLTVNQSKGGEKPLVLFDNEQDNLLRILKDNNELYKAVKNAKDVAELTPEAFKEFKKGL